MVERVRKAIKPEVIAATGSKRIMVHIYGAEENTLESRDIHVFETEPAYVRVNAGLTKNLGNYESLRVDVSISVPCYKETVSDTYQAVAEEVNSLLMAELDAYLKEGG